MCAFLGSVNPVGVPCLGAVRFVKAAVMGVFLCPPQPSDSSGCLCWSDQ